MIELSVSLPVWNSKKIAWLAMESLCRQKNIDFKWELVICEEAIGEYFGMSNFMKYTDRLKNVGCVIIKARPLEKWIPLSLKHRYIAQECSDTSKACVLQAADCYSQPYRLKESYDKIVKEGHDWICYKVGAFIDLHTWQHMLYDDRKLTQRAGLNMAFSMSSAKKLPNESKSRLVDGWLYKNLRIKNPCNIDTQHWKEGIDTHGLNNISANRSKYFGKDKHPFYTTDYKIDDYLPKDIVKRLKNLV